MTTKVESQSKRSLDLILGGYFGGMSATLIGSPLDTIKVRMQVQSSTNPAYSGALDCAMKTMRQEGLRTFFRGVTLPALFAGLGSAVSVGVASSYKDAIAKLDKNQENSFMHAFLGGGLAGATTALLGTPFDHVRIRMQIQPALTGPYSNSMTCFKHIAVTHGVKGVYSGLAATAWRNAVGSAWFFAGYEQIRDTFFKNDQGGLLMPIVSGSLGGTFSRLMSYPFDSVKSRIQADSLENPAYRSVYDCISKTVRKDGARVLFRGLTPNMLQGAPCSAAFWTTYEFVRTFMNKPLLLKA